MVVEGEPMAGGQLHDWAAVNKNAAAMIGLDWIAKTYPPSGLVPAASVAICLNVQVVRVTSDLSVASNSDEAAHRLTNGLADVPCYDDLERRGPVELARECRVEVELPALLERHLPSAGLVADRYGRNITL